MAPGSAAACVPVGHHFWRCEFIVIILWRNRAGLGAAGINLAQ